LSGKLGKYGNVMEFGHYQGNVRPAVEEVLGIESRQGKPFIAITWYHGPHTHTNYLST